MAGCSQRSPWRTATAPAADAKPGARAATAREDGSAIALATIARDPAVPALALLFPVAGVDPAHVENSFGDERDSGARRHNAIDIMAPRGTPILSAYEGRILGLSSSARGGISIYASDSSEQFVFYYAHLDRYQPGLFVGQVLQRGDTLGYVGTSGNAPKTVPHLHFQMMLMPKDRRYWNGEPINPYAMLRATGARVSTAP